MFLELGRIRAKSRKGVLQKVDAVVRKELLLDLANLQGTDCAPFWRRPFAPSREPDSGLLQVRDELREILTDGLSYTNKVSGILNRWLRWKPRDSDVECPSPFVVNAHIRSIRVNPGNLRVSLAFALTELLGKVGRCANPDCPSPYFFKCKKKYRFCDRPECQAFGQREYKREWWRKHGRQWLASRKELSGKVQKTRRRNQR